VYVYMFVPMYRHVVRALQQSRVAVLGLQGLLKFSAPHMEVRVFVMVIKVPVFR